MCQRIPLSLVRGLALIPALGRSVIRDPLMTANSAGGGGLSSVDERPPTLMSWHCPVPFRVLQNDFGVFGTNLYNGEQGRGRVVASSRFKVSHYINSCGVV